MDLHCSVKTAVGIQRHNDLSKVSGSLSLKSVISNSSLEAMIGMYLRDT